MEAGSLSYAVRPRVVGKYLGQLALLLGGLTIVPLLFALFDGERALAMGSAGAVAVLMGGGWLLQRLCTAQDVQPNEAVVVVAAIFILASLVLALSMMTVHVSFLDALFESVSGITTTGLSTFVSVADKPRSLLFEAAWLQWMGGLGIMVLSFALFFGQGTSAKLLSRVMGTEDSILGGTRAHASIVLRVYLSLTLVGIIALLVAGEGWFPAVTLTLAAVSTGGYSPYDSSLAGLGLPIQTVVVALCAAGAVAMPLYYEAARRHWRTVATDPELRALLIAGLLVAALLLASAVVRDHGGTRHLSDLALLAFSAQTTAGFSTLDIKSLDPFSRLMLIFSMMVGGGVGSSAGGIKLLRLIVLLKLAHLVIVRTRVTPHTVTRLHVAGREPGDDEILSVFLVIGLHVGAIVLSWPAFVWLGYDPLNSLFEVVSAVGTVGLSSGITGPLLHPVLKGILCLDMLLGRLEVLPILVLLAPRTWVGRYRRLESPQERSGVTNDENGVAGRDGPGGENRPPAD
jgi:trk/ktr system potassium uptake protein